MRRASRFTAHVTSVRLDAYEPTGRLLTGVTDPGLPTAFAHGGKYYLITRSNTALTLT
jgi:hypothetical protein